MIPVVDFGSSAASNAEGTFDGSSYYSDQGYLTIGMQVIISSTGGSHVFRIGSQPRVASAPPLWCIPVKTPDLSLKDERVCQFGYGTITRRVPRKLVDPHMRGLAPKDESRYESCCSDAELEHKYLGIFKVGKTTWSTGTVRSGNVSGCRIVSYIYPIKRAT